MKTSSVYADRANRLRNLFLNQADAMLVTTFSNICYLTGFRGLSPTERESAVVVTRDAVYLCIPAMYREEAEKLESIQDQSVQLATDTERDGLLFMGRRFLKKGQSVAVEADNLTVSEYSAIEARVAGRIGGKLVTTSGVVEQLRIRKDTAELDDIRKANDITTKVLNEFIARYTSGKSPVTASLIGATEYEVEDILRTLMYQFGGHGYGFDPIVASGPGSSMPHYHTGNRIIQNGDVLLIDIGIRYNGYTSDITRTFVVGKPAKLFEDVYKTVLACNREMLSRVKPGVPAATLHAQSVDFFSGFPHGEYIHGLGHGVGLDIHEEPYFRPGRNGILAPGMVLTIEPGLYLTENFGIRIEDYVVITESGCDNLTAGVPKDLTVLEAIGKP